MNCPKCNADIEILDYNDEPTDNWIVREWECKCPKCGYHGTYREFYKLTDFEWERIEE